MINTNKINLLYNKLFLFDIYVFLELVDNFIVIKHMMSELERTNNRTIHGMYIFNGLRKEQLQKKSSQHAN